MRRSGIFWRAAPLVLLLLAWHVRPADEKEVEELEEA